MVTGAANKQPADVTADDEDAVEPTRKQRALEVATAAANQFRSPIVLLGAFAAVYLLFGVMYMNNKSTADGLNAEVDRKRAILARPLPPEAGIQSSLASWTSAFQAAVDLRVTELPDSSLLGRILLAADDTGVSVISAGNDNRTITEIDGESYVATSVQVKAAGPLPNLERFVESLEQQAIDTLEIRNSIISQDANGYTVTLRLVVYSEMPRNVSTDTSDSNSGESSAASRSGDGGEGSGG